jgi:hypothetical protein
MAFTKLAAEIWRAFTLDGQAGSGAHKPIKADIRQWGLEVEQALNQSVFGGAFTLSGFNTPTTLSGDVNDYNPANLATALALRINGGAADRQITGLAGGSEGRIIAIHNIGGTNSLVLHNESAASSAANRFSFGYGIEIGINQSMILRYDGQSSRWRPLSYPPGGRILLGSGTLSGTTVVLATGIQVHFTKLELSITGLSFDAVNCAPLLQVSTNNGSSYDTTAANYHVQHLSGATTSSPSSANLMSPVNHAVAADTSNWTLEITGYRGGSYPRSRGGFNIGGGIGSFLDEYWGSTSPINALRMAVSGAGNFDAGAWALRAYL